MEQNEEKKKRWRPSMKLYREQQEVIERQCEELRAWREKYNALVKEKASGDAKTLRGHIESLEQENQLLRRSNSLMENELKNVRGDIDALRRLNNEQAYDIACLKNRGFWARLLNKDV